MGKTGRKVWYGVAMFLSGLVLLVSVAGIAGVWITERALANSVVQMLGAVENITISLRQATQGVDQKLGQMQAISTQISTASAQLSQNVTDQGLVLLLLPEQQEQKLVELSTSVRETFSTLRNMLAAGVTLYRSIDQLPFVNLPAPSLEQIDKIEGLVGEIQASVDTLKEDIAAFRSGVSDRIGKVEAGANQITSYLGQSRDQLAGLDARLAAAQEALVRLQQIVANALVLVAFLITLMLAWVIYSQVELLRLYTQRWKGIGTESRNMELSDRYAGVEDETGIEAGAPVPESPQESPDVE